MTEKVGTPKRVGRPPKKKESNPVGRPRGEASAMKEFRERMLSSPQSRKVLDSIFKAALDDEHKNQAAAWKLIMDRIAPTSGFEKEAGSLQRASIQVNITGVEGVNFSNPNDNDDIVDEQ
jgi:nitrate reductase alpha subunit